MAMRHELQRSKSYSTDECIDIEPNQYSLHKRDDIIQLLKLEHCFDRKLVKEAQREYLDLLKTESGFAEKYPDQFLKRIQVSDGLGDDAWQNQPCRQRIRNEKSRLSQLISKAKEIEICKDIASKAILQYSSLLESSQKLIQLEAKDISENPRKHQETEHEEQSKNLYPEGCDSEARESILLLLRHYEDTPTDISKDLLEEAKYEYIYLVKTEHQLKMNFREKFREEIEYGLLGYGTETHGQEESREFYINYVPSKGPIWKVIDKALDSDIRNSAETALHPYYTLKKSEELMNSLRENAPHSHIISHLKKGNLIRSASLDENRTKSNFLYSSEITKCTHESIRDIGQGAAKPHSKEWCHPRNVYDSRGSNDNLRDDGFKVDKAEVNVMIPSKHETSGSNYENVQNINLPSVDPEGSFRVIRRNDASGSEHQSEREQKYEQEKSFRGSKILRSTRDRSEKESYSSEDKKSSRSRKDFQEQGGMLENQEFEEGHKGMEDYEILDHRLHNKNTSVSSQLRSSEQKRSEPLQVLNKKSSLPNQENKPKEHPGSVPDMSIYIPHPDILGDYVPKKNYVDVYKSWQMQKSDIDELTNRLSSFASKQLTEGNPNITDLSDKNRPTKIGENFGLIYDDEWSEAFEDLSSDTGLDQEHLIYKLLRIIRYGYQHCSSKAALLLDSLEESMKHAVVDPLSVLRTEEKKKKVKCVDKIIQSSTQKFAKDYRKTTAQVSAEEVILDFIKSKIVRETFGVDHSKLSENVKKYIRKCIEQLWFMAVQDPPMYIEYAEPGTQIQKEFYKFFERKGAIVELTVWPVVFLHKDGPLISKGFVLPRS